MLDAAISRRFLICSYGPEYMGLVTGAMEAAGCSCDFVYRPRGRKKRYPDSFDPMRHHALVILGDDQQHADHSRYEPEKDWVRAAIEQGSAVLGICHGAQLLSWPSCRTEESSVLRMVGTILMRDCGLAMTNAGREDCILQHIPADALMYQAHGDIFELPPGATNLADSCERRNYDRECWCPPKSFRICQNWMSHGCTK